MPTIGELAPVAAAARGRTFSRAALNKRVAASPISMVIELQGERVLAEDFMVFAQNADPIVAQIVMFFGEGLKEVAKQIHIPNIDTQATYDSISAGPEPGGPPQIFRAEGGGWGIDVGPFTKYAPLQEFGFTHYLSGEWIQNPFMIPASDIIDPLFTDAMIQLAEVAQDRRYFTGPVAQSPAANHLAGIRNALYSYSKFAGDIQIFGIGGLSASRGAALRGARVLGDVDAGMTGAIGTRFQRRFTGRFASGGLSTVTSATLFGPSTAFTGASGRIYNRIRGQVFGESLRGI